MTVLDSLKWCTSIPHIYMYKTLSLPLLQRNELIGLLKSEWNFIILNFHINWEIIFQAHPPIITILSTLTLSSLLILSSAEDPTSCYSNSAFCILWYRGQMFGVPLLLDPQNNLGYYVRKIVSHIFTLFIFPYLNCWSKVQFC